MGAFSTPKLIFSQEINCFFWDTEFCSGLAASLHMAVLYTDNQFGLNNDILSRSKAALFIYFLNRRMLFIGSTKWWVKDDYNFNGFFSQIN